MPYDRLAPTISSKAKKLFGSGNMGQNNWGAENLKKKFSGRNLYKNMSTYTAVCTIRGLNKGSLEEVCNINGPSAYLLS